MEPLYSGHHWDHSKCPDVRGFLISGVDFIHICMYLWQNQVSGFEGVSRFEGVRSEGFHCIMHALYMYMYIHNSNNILHCIFLSLLVDKVHDRAAPVGRIQQKSNSELTLSDDAREG